MTTAEPTGPHPEVDRLADFAAGDLPDTDTVARHLAGCADCRATVATLREADDAVLSRLAGVPALEKVPADVAERLDLALSAASGASLTVLPAERGAPARRRVRAGAGRGGWPAWLAGAAAVVTVLALGIAIGVGALGGSSGSGRNGQGGQPTTAAGGATANGAVTASNRNYTEASLGAELPALLAGHAGPPAAAARPVANGQSATGSKDTLAAPVPSGALASAQDLRTLAQPEQLRHCVANLTATPVAPQATPWLAVDLARWNGQPAAVILLPSPGKPAFVDAFVVAPGCPTGTFLYYHHYARPAG